MLLPFTDDLVPTSPWDGEMAIFSDRHYSRRTVGARQFMYSGRKLVLRNTEGTILFGWIWAEDDKRDDGQTGYNCTIFRNESPRKASDIILEAEKLAFAKWGPNRLYTYIDPAKTATITALRDYPKWGVRRGERIVGFCYRKAGWKPVIHKNGKPHLSNRRLQLFVKPCRTVAGEQAAS
jgi:hypothetical protein